MLTMFKQLKKFIALMLCAAVFNVCVMPAAELLAKRPIFKNQDKPAKASSDRSSDKQEKPTMQETWEKIWNRDFKSLNKADAWNLVKSAGCALSAVAIAYLLFRSKPADGNGHNGHGPDRPSNQPNIIIPETLQNIMNNDQYGPEYNQKIKELCRDDYNKQLKVKGFPDLKDNLEKAINETSTPTPEFIKGLIDGRYNALQNHLKKKNIVIPAANKDADNTKKTTVEEPSFAPTFGKGWSAGRQKKPVILYPHAQQTQRQNIKVVRQRGASCGYHAVLNSVLSIHGVDENQANELINTKFAQRDGTWRAPIIQIRKKALVHYYIENIIHECLHLTQEQQAEWNIKTNSWLFGWYYRNIATAPKRQLNAPERRALNLIAHAYAHAFMLDENLNILQENPADLTTQLQNLIRHYRPHIQLADEQNCLQCIQTIDLAKLQGKIAAADKLINTAVTYAYGLNLETDLYGNNLNTDEMELLKNLALQEYGINDNVITIIDNTHVLNAEAYKDIILAPAKEQMLNNDCRHSFCIRTQINSAYNQQEVDQLTAIINDTQATQEEKNDAVLKRDTIQGQLHANTGATHWISVTLHRNNTQNLYDVKDSMGNDYTNHPNVLQLIEALEQPAIAQPIETQEQQSASGDLTTTQTNKDVTSTSTETTNTNAEKQNTEEEAIAMPLSNTQRLASISTLAQSDSSCAYHALKNADAILHMLQKPEILAMQNNFNFEAIATRIGKGLCSKLSKAKVIELFDEKNKLGTWRELILPERLREAGLDKTMTIQTALTDYKHIPKLKCDDLSDDELQYLIDNGNIENAHNISIIARIAPDFTGMKIYALRDILEDVKIKMLNDNCTHAFLIRSGFVHVEDDNKAHRGTHWICVVLYRVNGQNHYIIADSLGKNRTNDQDVTFLIEQLESKTNI